MDAPNGTPPAEPGPQGVARIKPSPVPTALGVMPIPDAKVIALIATTPVGSAWYFISPDSARATALNLVNAADEVTARNLTIAQPGDVPPIPPGL